jgi:hypothetical protein
MNPSELVALRALADIARIRILGRLAARPADPETLAAELRLPLPVVARQVEVLVAAGLAERLEPGGRLVTARADRVGALGKALAALERSAAGLGDAGSEGAWPHEGEPLAATLDRIEASPEERRTVRAFLVDGRLVSIPAQGRKRQVVLRLLLERVFTEDRDYPEKEVNARLALFHPDVAALRRYLVDERMVDREAGLYRRRQIGDTARTPAGTESD